MWRGWHGRIWDAQQEGVSIKICWECGCFLNTTNRGVIKGLAEQDPEKFYLAQLFLAWVAFPEIQVQLSKNISFGPINLKALPLLDGPEFDHVREYLPTSPANIPYAIIHDEQDTAVRFNDIYPRYLEFLQGE